MGFSSREEEKRLRNAYEESNASPSPYREIKLVERGNLLFRQYFSQSDNPKILQIVDTQRLFFGTIKEGTNPIRI